MSQFVPFEIARKLKEFNFDDPCFGFFEVSDLIKDGHRLRFVEHEESNPCKNNQESSDVAAPTIEQVVDWFETKGLFILIECTNTKYPEGSWRVEISKNNDCEYVHFGYNNKRSAKIAAIEKAIELYENRINKS